MRILIADDHALFRRGLRLVLEDLFPGVDTVEAHDLDEALSILRNAAPPDLLLLDLSMPGMVGAGGDRHAGIARLLKAHPQLPLIVLSAHAEAEDITRAMELGAAGYVPKGASESVLRHAIALVVAGENYVPPTVLGMSRLQPRSHGHGRRPVATSATPPGAGPLGELTPRQRDTLALIVLGQSNKEIARNLGLLESTVKAHVRVILHKLHAANRTHAARIALELGFEARPCGPN